MSIIADTSNGQLRLQGNETITDAKDADAAKVRVGSRHVPGKSGGGGAYSFDVIEEVSEGNHRTEAVVMVGGFNGSGGELGICIWNGVEPITDPGQPKVVEMRHNEIEFKVPIRAPNLAGGGVTDTMWAPDGRTFTQQQSDGNFVTYTASAPWSKANATAVWSAWTGKIG